MAISFLTAPATQLYTPVSVATQPAADASKTDVNASPDITININDAKSPSAQSILGTLLGGASAQPTSLLTAAPQQPQSLLGAVASPLVAAQPSAANPFGASANLFGAPAGMGMAASPFGQFGANPMAAGMPGMGMNPAMMGGMNPMAGAGQGAAAPQQNGSENILNTLLPILLEKLKGKEEEKDPLAELLPVLLSAMGGEEGDTAVAEDAPIDDTASVDDSAPVEESFEE